jgi:hypothetical protein
MVVMLTWLMWCMWRVCVLVATDVCGFLRRLFVVHCARLCHDTPWLVSTASHAAAPLLFH